MTPPQLAQYYLGALVGGGVLCAGSLLVARFERRGEDEAFTPAAWAVALASALVLGGLGGLVGVVCWPEVGQQRSLLPAGIAAVGGGALGIWLQRAASAASRTPEAAPTRGEGSEGGSC